MNNIRSIIKKIYLFIFMLLVMPLSAFASNVYQIDIDVYLDKYGNATIKETWDVMATDGSEWYKPLYNLKNSKVSNFKVTMDGKSLTYKEWDISESLSEKAGYYGIVYNSSGVELCFGKSDYKRHEFVLTYKFSNLVFNTSGEQVLYNTFIPPLSDVTFSGYKVIIHSYYNFPNTLDVWGYGTKGLVYVSNGKIYSTNGNYSISKEQPVVLLVKFPKNTFDTVNEIKGYDTFNDVLKEANKGTFKYDYTEKKSIKTIFKSIFSNIGLILENSYIIIMSAIVLFSAFLQLYPSKARYIRYKFGFNRKYGYRDNKFIYKKNTPMFRDIPCNKNLYYANVLLKINDFEYRSVNILGAIILKWVKEGKVKLVSIEKKKDLGILFDDIKDLSKKEMLVLDLTLNPSFSDERDKKLFDMMYEASDNGILRQKAFSRWCHDNSEEFLSFFNGLVGNILSKLKENGYIVKNKNDNNCKAKNIMDDKIYEDSMQLYGLKLYLEEFTRMKEKDVMDVHLWEEYLMFAYLFGIADKVMKKLNKLYPEFTYSFDQYNYSLEAIKFINDISTVSLVSASRGGSDGYSSGGGGYSTGGGGGGSVGGGGSGCSR